MDRLYSASASGPALCNGQPIRATVRSDPEGASLLIPKADMAAEHWKDPAPAVIRAFRSSVAYRLCLIADGSFDGLLSFRPAWEWDIAAGALIATRAGAAVSDRHNRRLCFNTPPARSNGILAAPPSLHDALCARMRP